MITSAKIKDSAPMPSKLEIILLISILILSVGVAFEFTWPIGLIVAGSITTALCITAKWRGVQ